MRLSTGRPNHIKGAANAKVLRQENVLEEVGKPVQLKNHPGES